MCNRNLVLNYGLIIPFFQLAFLVFAVAVIYVKGQKQETIPILKYDNEGVNFDGSYKWA